MTVNGQREVSRPTFTEDVLGTSAFNKSAFLIGSPGAGKSTCLHVCARTWTITAGKDIYLFGKSIDPPGTLSKAGIVSAFGAMVITDFDCQSLMQTQLTDEGLKSLVDVQEGGHCPARHFRAILPRKQPRLFAAQGGQDGDPGSWFERNRLFGLAVVARGQFEELAKLPQDQQAMCRRAVFFVCPPVVSTAEQLANLEEQDEVRVEQGMRRLQAWREQHQ